MQRIVIQHVTGSKANQEEAFAVADTREILIGRDPACGVRFDEDKDDSVSRRHAKIDIDPLDPTKAVITDTASSNGVFVNKHRVGTAPLAHGDVVQLGADGPEFMFKLEPPPPNVMKATRVIATQVQKPTREVPLTGAGAAAPATQAAAQPAADAQTRPIGRATVERIVTEGKQESKKSMRYVIAAMLGVIALVAAVFIWRESVAEKERQAQVTAQLKAAEEAKKRTDEIAAKQGMSAREVAEKYTSAVVLIEFAWSLVDTASNKQVFHRYHTVTVDDANGEKKKVTLPLYIRLPGGEVEPWLVTDDGGGLNRAIGSDARGTGFVVAENGFILTNRHVGASWLTTYRGLSFPGELYAIVGNELKQEGIIKEPIGGLNRWVPAKASMLGGKDVGKRLEGRIDKLDITFPKTKTRVQGRVARISQEHDVTMLKVDLPVALTKVELFDNYDTIQPGDPITVMGYPGVSPDVVAITRQQETINVKPDIVTIPDVSVNPGVISKVLRGKQQTAQAGRDELFSYGDQYQINVDAGGGNSGGPVFDKGGKVIGIFYSARQQDLRDAKVAFVVPIRYGLDLMGIEKVLK